MRFANIGGRACILQADRALDIESASHGTLSSDPSVYAAVANHATLAELAATRESQFVEFSAADLGPPILRSTNVLAVALNYPSHAEETSRDAPAEPVFFAKSSSSVCGPYDAIEVAGWWERVDYEAEVVAVIGRRMRDVPADAVWAGVAGVTAGQDISDRAEQAREPLRQFSFAKSYDTFAPIGPVLTTIDEFADPDNIELIGRVDGVEVQHARTCELVTSIPDLISWISARITLEPGDLVFTGTPAGVGNRRTPQLFLRPGMTVETEIPGVGTMVNPVRRRTDETDGLAVIGKGLSA